MIAQLLRLFALRPFLTIALFGIPLFVLVAIGLVTVFALKFIVFIVLPIVLVVWVIRKLTRGPAT
ncbi:MAG TPA: hypothetical protein VFJ74_01485 [Gemmatimonadaceae bacterium]|nr:hypothetical protein [Gemmatimonadaceae bacterium]